MPDPRGPELPGPARVISPRTPGSKLPNFIGLFCALKGLQQQVLVLRGVTADQSTVGVIHQTLDLFRNRCEVSFELLLSLVVECYRLA
jgi:hypothetical protein